MFFTVIKNSEQYHTSLDASDFFFKLIYTFCFISWYDNLSVQNKNCLSSTVSTASKITSVGQFHCLKSGIDSVLEQQT